MNVGDFFKIDGYNKFASFQTDHGEVVVLCNESSHYLVASVADESMSDGEGIHGRLEASYPYDIGNANRRYKEALRFAINLADQHISPDEEA